MEVLAPWHDNLKHIPQPHLIGVLCVICLPVIPQHVCMIVTIISLNHNLVILEAFYPCMKKEKEKRKNTTTMHDIRTHEPPRHTLKENLIEFESHSSIAIWVRILIK